MRFVSQGYACYPVDEGIVFRKDGPEGDAYLLFDGSTLRDVGREGYWEAVMGPAAAAILRQVADDPGHVARHASGYVATCHVQESTVHLFTPRGALKSKFSPAGSGFGLCAIAWAGDDLWCAAPAERAVYRLSPVGSLLQALGGPQAEPDLFDHPEHVAVHAGRLYVSDLGRQQVVCWDPEAGTLTPRHTFDEPVWAWSFAPRLGGPVVSLESGLYRLEA